MKYRIQKVFMASTALLFFLCASSVAEQEWQELKSGHFIAYFTEDKSFVKQMLCEAERYYRNIALDLGYPRYSEFWIWDDRVKIYIYPDRESFLEATGQPEWSAGMADYKNRYIASYVWSENFIKSVLPHEMAHLIFRDFVGFKGKIPLWLDEGVAQWAEELKRDKMKEMIKEAYKEDKVLSIEDLTKLDIRRFKEMDRIYIRITKTREGKEGLLFLDTKALVDIYYLQAVSVVGFLIQRYGSDRFCIFCRQLRNGKTLEDALKFSYPAHIRGLEDLEDEWREYLEEELKKDI